MSLSAGFSLSLPLKRHKICAHPHFFDSLKPQFAFDDTFFQTAQWHVEPIVNFWAPIVSLCHEVPTLSARHIKVILFRLGFVCKLVSVQKGVVFPQVSFCCVTRGPLTTGVSGVTRGNKREAYKRSHTNNLGLSICCGLGTPPTYVNVHMLEPPTPPPYGNIWSPEKRKKRQKGAEQE